MDVGRARRRGYTRGMSVARGDLQPVSASAVAYCRAARRLRGRLADRPVRLHRALRELGMTEAAPALARRAGDVAAEPVGLAGGFAAEVERRMDGPVLRLAQRRTLLAKAQRMGIGRFEANLVIAAVQHERRAGPGPRQTTSALNNGYGAGAASALLALMLQALIAWGAWRVWCG